MTDLKPGWQRVKFGEVVRLNKETCKDPEAAGVNRVIGLEHLEPGDLRVRSWADVADGTTFSNRVRPGQVLFGKRRAYQRKVAVADFDAICSGDIYVFESSDQTQLLQELLPFICQTDSFFGYAIGTSAGSLSPRTNWKSLAEYEFALPPLEEQLQILLCLRASQDVSEHVAKLSVDAAALVRAFQEHEIARFFQKSPLAALPDLCELITVGIVVTPAKYYVNAGGVPALRSLNVWPGRFDLSDVKYLSAEGHVKHSKSRLRSGDVVMVRTGDPGRPGNAAVVDDSMSQWNCIDLVLVRPGEALRPKYLESFLNWSISARRLNGLSPGTKQKHLSVSALERFVAAVPPICEQDQFLLELEKLSNAASWSASRLSKYQVLNKRLISQLLGDS